MPTNRSLRRADLVELLIQLRQKQDFSKYRTNNFLRNFDKFPVLLKCFYRVSHWQGFSIDFYRQPKKFVMFLENRIHFIVKCELLARLHKFILPENCSHHETCQKNSCNFIHCLIMSIQTMYSSDEDESDVNINDLWTTQKPVQEEEKDEAKVSKKIMKKLSTM